MMYLSNPGVPIPSAPAGRGHASPSRSYHSPLREARARETRDRILGGLVRSMARGVAELSIPAVAREAGVSVATVYRHFPTKAALLDALPLHLAKKMGLQELPTPRTTRELEAFVRQLFSTLDGLDDEARAAMVSQLGQQARQAQLPSRLAATEAALREAAPALDEAARARVARLILVLTSSSSLRLLKSVGLSTEEAADDVVSAMRQLLATEG